MKLFKKRAYWSWYALVCLLLLAACQPQTAAPDPQAAANRRQTERATLASVTVVQKWQQQALISQPENFAPSIIPLDNGDYRVYWNAPSLNGIGSATSPDGLRFNTDDNARLINAPAGQADCSMGKPWVVPVVNGYRMYFQGQPDNCNAPVTGILPKARIFSAFSSDGKEFTRDPGIRIDIGDVTNLAAAGHGRVIQVDDGSFHMVFTALLPDKGTTPYIMAATSIDTITWTVDAKPILENGHDPTALQIESTVNLYVSYMTENTLLLQSTDGGQTFMPAAWLEFYDAQNKLISGMHDLDIIDIADGSLVIYGSGTGTNGIMTFTQQAAS